MGGIFSKPKAPPPPPPPPPPPGKSDAEIQAAKEEERKRAALRKGRSSTITGAGLLSDTETTGLLGG